ncbi:MAG: hypothetical protein HY544_00690 [Candidatus Diapherotrites archaeon]|uniref:Uncharacterized protein n=1 Tax=Candidatus Iainarchaeum sp. TaxID=3101447 RepID=A0A8T3YP91_9ARCH|nr:hypothetical protein [Candidatus Diapherotrites archaeon]
MIRNKKESEVAQSAISQQLEDRGEAENIVSGSRLTEKDIKGIAGRVNREMLKHFEELSHETAGTDLWSNDRHLKGIRVKTGPQKS